MKKRIDGFGIARGAKPFEEEEKEGHEEFFSLIDSVILMSEIENFIIYYGVVAKDTVFNFGAQENCFMQFSVQKKP